jgi:5-carboxymethyl-2-hydroxymuconic-semialdehyde dehydrogenase
MLATWRIAPALAAGNTVVAKPPEWAPLTASLLADITRDAGLPDGVFNVVQGLGAEAGAPLVAHPDVARVAFTGSVATGRQVAAAAGAQLTPVSLELGGKSPLIVFADADLDLAVGHAVGQFDNAGQVCLAGTRLLVDEAIAGEFTARFTVRAGTLRQGDPRDEATDIGPNISRAHLDRVDGYVRRAIAAGAHPLLGGAVSAGLGGLYYQPTLLGGAAPGSEILTEEVFGPVLTLQTFTSEAEAVALANGTPYGLAATMFTGDKARAERVSARLVAGTVWVNCFFVRDLAAPFGGAGLSGIGREGGTWSFDFYSDVKNTVYAGQGWSPDG